DLYYRVAVVMIKVPPLRDRKVDIPLLVEHFLRKFSQVYQKPIRRVAPSVMDRLVALPWPGNVRQLENFLEQAVVLADGESLTERDLPDAEYPLPGASPAPALQLEPGLPLGEVERRYILHTLQKVRGNRTQAAKILGISLRCLQYKFKSYSQAAAPETPPGEPEDGSARRSTLP
ncbi:MAG: sigma-54-dependent Fis family transcriptional regulator, partial [Planctomycetes bacterium]|nr:sigma-54-dependent Fis family transcriptional regulator [Planctomycetota bacterium]